MAFKTADVRGEYAKNKQLKEEDVKSLQQWGEKQPHLPALTDPNSNTYFLNMPLITADIRAEYTKNEKLTEEDVKALQQWAQLQPHLPPITEIQIILFLQSCYFSLESAKSAIDVFYTAKTHCPEFFANRDPYAIKEDMELSLYTPLPKRTHDNYRVLYCKVMVPDASKFVFSEQIKIFDMSTMLCLMEEGTADGLVIIYDMELIRFGHLTKLGVLTMKKFFYYLQESLPVRLLGLHFINVVSFMDKILAIMKPFIKKELLEVLHIHSESIESLYKFVPKECLPKDLGGTADSSTDLHANMKRKLQENAEYFKEDEKLIVDESKRPGKPKNVGDVFGVEGTFKKLDID